MASNIDPAHPLQAVDPRLRRPNNAPERVSDYHARIERLGLLNHVKIQDIAQEAMEYIMENKPYRHPGRLPEDERKQYDAWMKVFQKIPNEDPPITTENIHSRHLDQLGVSIWQEVLEKLEREEAPSLSPRLEPSSETMSTSDLRGFQAPPPRRKKTQPTAQYNGSPNGAAINASKLQDRSQRINLHNSPAYSRERKAISDQKKADAAAAAETAKKGGAKKEDPKDRDREIIHPEPGAELTGVATFTRARTGFRRHRKATNQENLTEEDRPVKSSQTHGHEDQPKVDEAAEHDHEAGWDEDLRADQSYESGEDVDQDRKHSKDQPAPTGTGAPQGSKKKRGFNLPPGGEKWVADWKKKWDSNDKKANQETMNEYGEKHTIEKSKRGWWLTGSADFNAVHPGQKMPNTFLKNYYDRVVKKKTAPKGDTETKRADGGAEASDNTPENEAGPSKPRKRGREEGDSREEETVLGSTPALNATSQALPHLLARHSSGIPQRSSSGATTRSRKRVKSEVPKGRDVLFTAEFSAPGSDTDVDEDMPEVPDAATTADSAQPIANVVSGFSNAMGLASTSTKTNRNQRLKINPPKVTAKPPVVSSEAGGEHVTE